MQGAWRTAAWFCPWPSWRCSASSPASTSTGSSSLESKWRFFGMQERISMALQYKIFPDFFFFIVSSFPLPPLEIGINSFPPTIVADQGCLSRIPDPRLSIPDPHQRIYLFWPKKWFLSFRKYDPGCSSRIPDPSRGQKGIVSRIRVGNTASYIRKYQILLILNLLAKIMSFASLVDWDF